MKFLAIFILGCLVSLVYSGSPAYESSSDSLQPCVACQDLVEQALIPSLNPCIASGNKYIITITYTNRPQAMGRCSVPVDDQSSWTSHEDVVSYSAVNSD